jgi:hypothetical protein
VSYFVVAFARCVLQKDIKDMTVALTSADGSKIYDSQTFFEPGNTWTKGVRALKSKVDDPTARLELRWGRVRGQLHACGMCRDLLCCHVALSGYAPWAQAVGMFEACTCNHGVFLAASFLPVPANRRKHASRSLAESLPHFLTVALTVTYSQPQKLWNATDGRFYIRPCLLLGSNGVLKLLLSFYFRVVSACAL